MVFGEHTLKGRNLDLVGEAHDFRPGDRYIFRSELTDAQDAVAGHLFVDCSVQFAKKDSCSQHLRDPRTRNGDGRGPDPGLAAQGRRDLGARDHGRHRRVRERRGLRDG